SMLISLSGNNQVAPSFWLNPTTGVSYNVGVQTSQYRIDSLDELLRTPVTAPSSAITTTASGSPAAAAGSVQLLSSLVAVKRGYGPVIINHYNVAPVFNVFANVDRRDRGSVGGAVEGIMEEERANLPRGTTLALRGEYETMRSSFFRLGLGIVFA